MKDGSSLGPSESGPARERVLTSAERLFSERGYAAVTLRDIADAVGIRQATLYYHVPGGKEELFVEVTERGLARHRAGLEAAIAAAEPTLRARLQAVAQWLLAHPPLDLARMTRSDMPEIGEAHARRLTNAAFESVLLPIQRVFDSAREAGQIRPFDATLLAGTYLSIIEGLQEARRHAPNPVLEMADDMIDVMLGGVLTR